MADMLWLNILTLLLCIPIVTAGAALTAMNYMALKIVRNEDCYITRGYFKSFKENFRQATIIWAVMLIIAFVLYGDYQIFKNSGVEFPQALKIAVVAVAIFLLLICTYIFPVLSRYENSIRNTVKNAAIMAIVSIPKAVLMLIIWCIPIVLLVIFPKVIPFIFFFGISVPTLLCAYLYNGTFKRFEPNITEGEGEADPDQWHVYKEGEEELDKEEKEAIAQQIQDNLEEIGERTETAETAETGKDEETDK